MRALSEANAHFVTDRLLVGGDLDVFDADLAARQLAELVAAGVTHVVDCRFELDDTATWQQVPGVSYRRFPVDDAGQRIPAAWFEAGVDHVLDALGDDRSVVLTHCHMGVNRGPSLGFAVLLALGRDPVEAIDAIRAARPIANVYYAEDALTWHHQRTRASAEQRRADARRLRAWRRDNPLDVQHVIATIRRESAPGW
ncbi:MAG TPA: dual specificity protein phosphatase [Marmoricola sp.]|nr:dual specificity protein phosphatase [Marmoricola sp.]